MLNKVQLPNRETTTTTNTTKSVTEPVGEKIKFLGGGRGWME